MNRTNEVNQDVMVDQGTSRNTSMYSVSAAVDSSEVLLQVIPVKVISNSGHQITTYGLNDSASDITMVDPSLVKLLNIDGTPSKLSLTTVNSADVEEMGLKVNFKIASLDSKNVEQYLKKCFCRDPELEYRDVIQECVDKGYARKLSKEGAVTVSDITWYIPHHPVTNPDKPGKARVVFDAAARFNGTSLNDQLLQGPCLTNDLTGVLIRFREEEVAFSADIEGMFYQTNLMPSDTDALRFLWWPSSIDDTPEDYKMLLHIFGAKSSPYCANKALSMTAQDNEGKKTRLRSSEQFVETVK